MTINNNFTFPGNTDRTQLKFMGRAEQAGKYIMDRMSSELNRTMHYHNTTHVMDVYHAAEMIGKLEGVSDSEMELLKVAVLFHDSGYMISTENHEARSCEIARSYLPEAGFNGEEIETICGLIMATCVPQQPKNHLEKIICDADLDYLGRDDFFTTGNNIYQEFKARDMVSGERDWNELQVSFLTAHHYFTETSRKLRGAQKEKHIEMIRQLLEKKI